MAAAEAQELSQKFGSEDVLSKELGNGAIKDDDDGRASA